MLIYKIKYYKNIESMGFETVTLYYRFNQSINKTFNNNSGYRRL